MTSIPHVSIGSSGDSVSRLGLGCMGMSDLYGVRDDRESTATIHAALDAGINFLDTADMYGPHTNEVLVGEAIQTRRGDVFLATKFGIMRDPENPQKRIINGRPDYVRSACDASLRRLNVDCIDLYYQHRVDPDVPIEETVGAMSELVEAGKARLLGLSEASVETIRRASTVHPIAAVQSEYSLWSRDVEDDGVVAFCCEHGILFVGYAPLGRGFLTGQIKSIDDLPLDDYRRHAPRFLGDNFRKNLEFVEQIAEIATEKQVTPAQLALAWVLAQGEQVVPLFGTKRVRYLQENIDAVAIQLSADDLAQIEAAAPQGAISGDRYPAAMMRHINS